jgi:glucose 1-dehydrogenase
MQALVVTPGTAGSTRVAEVPDARAAAGEVLIRPLEIGVCGTDSEISAGVFGVPPEGEADLILGHELLAEVVETGELVAATVRRSCGRCAACAAGSPDSCLTGAYRERGITRLHGFASGLAAEAPANLVPIPKKLGRLGVLAEPSSVVSRAIRHAQAIGQRQAWEPARALVLGAGAVGMLATFFLRLEGLEVWTESLEPPGSEKAQLVEAAGARYGLENDDAGFDLVIEAAGSAELMVRGLGLLRRNGVACVLGIDAHQGTVPIERRLLGLDTVIENRAVFGSVNAHPQDWATAVRRLTELKKSWPEAAGRLVGLRVDPDRFQEAFDFRGVKATVRFG